METSKDFRKRVKEVWGDPRRVAEAGINELYYHGNDLSLDHDDQVRYARDIGILAGELKTGDPEEFIRRYEAEILI